MHPSPSAAVDAFCTELGERLDQVRSTSSDETERRGSNTREPWWPFPDSRRCSSLELHSYRNAQDSTTAPPKDQNDDVAVSGILCAGGQLDRRRSHDSGDARLSVQQPTIYLSPEALEDEFLPNSPSALDPEWSTIRSSETPLNSFGWDRPAEEAAGPVRPPQQQPRRQSKHSKSKESSKRQSTHYAVFDPHTFGTRRNVHGADRRLSLLSTELRFDENAPLVESPGDSRRPSASSSTSKRKHDSFMDEQKSGDQVDGGPVKAEDLENSDSLRRDSELYAYGSRERHPSACYDFGGELSVF